MNSLKELVEKMEALEINLKEFDSFLSDSYGELIANEQQFDPDQIKQMGIRSAHSAVIKTLERIQYALELLKEGEE